MSFALRISLILLMLGTIAHADPAAICERASADAAARTGTPLDVLRAISLTETGRRIGGVHRPWPWTINVSGEGFWFDTREEAVAFARKQFRAGRRSFDIGCFQINYKWHGEHFGWSIERMFDQAENATYAAQFLARLYTEFGDWARAAGGYHSRTPKFAERYAKRFRRIIANLDDVPDAAPGEYATKGAGRDVELAAVAPAPEQPARRDRPDQRGLSLLGVTLDGARRGHAGSAVVLNSSGNGLLRGASALF